MKDTELLEISGSGLDQPIPASLELLDFVDQVITKAIQEENVQSAMDMAKKALGLTRIAGLSLAKLLFKIKVNWSKFYIDDSFDDYCNSELGLAPITLTRYIRVWETLFESRDILPEIADKLKLRPMRDLVSLSTALVQDYEISDEKWSEIADAPDSATIQETLRNIKGTPPRSNALLIRIKRNGDLVAYKDGQQYFCGYLSIEETSEVVQAAIDRILSASGILKE